MSNKKNSMTFIHYFCLCLKFPQWFMYSFVLFIAEKSENWMKFNDLMKKRRKIKITIISKLFRKNHILIWCGGWFGWFHFLLFWFLASKINTQCKYNKKKIDYVITNSRKLNSRELRNGKFIMNEIKCWRIEWILIAWIHGHCQNEKV